MWVCFVQSIFMQKWKILSKERDQLWTDTMINKLKLRLSSLRYEG